MCKKFMIFGAGNEGKKLIKHIDKNSVECFVDNAPELRGKLIDGIKVISAYDLMESYENQTIIISTVRYEDQIKKQLRELDIFDVFNQYEREVIDIFAKTKHTKKRLLLLNTNDNVNVGDQAIAWAEYYFVAKYMPDYDLLEFSESSCMYALEEIKKHTADDDIILISGGGYLGTLWMQGGENTVRSIISLFISNKIIIFPQTIYFSNDEEGNEQFEITKQIYNKHNNLTICYRDKNSYEIGNKISNGHINNLFVPDMVALLNVSNEIFTRNGILICFREDKESVIDSKYMSKIVGILTKFDITYMSMLADEGIGRDDRMEHIKEKLYCIQKSRLVITDRLHCMLLCAISGTPCLAFDNISKKVSGAYYWIKNNRYVHIVEPQENFEDLIQSGMEMPVQLYDNEHIQKEFCRLALHIIGDEV